MKVLMLGACAAALMISPALAQNYGQGGGYGGGGEPDPWASDSSSSGGGYSDEPPF